MAQYRPKITFKSAYGQEKNGIETAKWLNIDQKSLSNLPMGKGKMV